MQFKATVLLTLGFAAAAAIVTAVPADVPTTTNEPATLVAAASCTIVSPLAWINTKCDLKSGTKDDGKHRCVEGCIKLGDEKKCLDSYCDARHDQNKDDQCYYTCGEREDYGGHKNADL